MEESHVIMCDTLNQDPSYTTASKEWVITSPPWCVIVSTIQKGVMHVSSMVTSFTSLENHSIKP